jgi:allophanate hydrolase
LSREAVPGEVALAVVGAHISGMPLNHELRDLGARFLETTTTAPDYRLYALAGTRPPKPGMLRVIGDRGVSIEVEVWALSTEAFGRFVGAVPSPLSIGTVLLDDGRAVKGFLVEAEGVTGARDISAFGGWRNYVVQERATA